MRQEEGRLRGAPFTKMQRGRGLASLTFDGSGTEISRFLPWLGRVKGLTIAAARRRAKGGPFSPKKRHNEESTAGV